MEPQQPTPSTKSPVVPIVIAMMVAVVLLIVTMVILENRREYNARYPGCWQLIGTNDRCEVEHAANRLMGRY